VRAYFEEGGKRLYVARAFRDFIDDSGPLTPPGNTRIDGIARWSIDDETSLPGNPPDRVQVRARYPGAAGNRLLTFRLRLGPNVLDTAASPATLRSLERFEVVWVQTAAEATTSPPSAGRLYWVDRYFDAEGRPSYRLRLDDPANPPGVDTLTDLSALAQVRSITVAVDVIGRGRYRGRFEQPKTFDDLTFHPATLAPGPRRSLSETFAADPSRRSTALFVPIVLETSGLVNGVEVAEALVQLPNIAGTGTVIDALEQLAEGATPGPTEDELSCRIELHGGSDGRRANPTGYAGGEDPSGSGEKSGLETLEDLEDISIVAVPGASFGGLNGYAAQMRSITGLLLSHCERMRYRVAVLDAADGALPGEVRAQRAVLDSKYGALYYPWVEAFDPITEGPILLPPSGFITGIYARSDVERGVHKAPANEVVRLATGFELLLNKGQQEALNPLGINCLRFFEGRGFRVWGARTISSDPEWKYINLRRNFAYLGRSIDIGTQWAVFEPNSETLWGNVRRSVEDFLYNEWKSRRLMGINPEEAYFVRCDRTTMTQSDIDNGRLICLVGVALLRPAEFVIFRIGQKTLDFKGR
jgi:hypothetical protein